MELYSILYTIIIIIFFFTLNIQSKQSSIISICDLQLLKFKINLVSF